MSAVVDCVVRVMRPSRWTPLLALTLQGCAILALVGENPDGGRADVPPPDVLGFTLDAGLVPPAMDVPVPPPMDVPVPPSELPPPPTDLPPTDVVTRDRPEPSGAGLDVGDAGAPMDLPDVVINSDATITQEASTMKVPDGALEDATMVLPDGSSGAVCRRDFDCRADPAGNLCNQATMRCWRGI